MVPDAFEFTTNSSRYHNEHYRELAGKHVAWAFDGSFLRAASTLEELCAALGERVYEDCVLDYINPLPVVVTSATPLSRAS